MTQYSIYRTEKGNLTFKPNGDIVYTVRSKTKAGAEHMLKLLKIAEKQTKDNV